MSMWLMALFTTPVQLTGLQRLLLLVPLCLSVSLVYKTTRCAQVRDIPVATFALWLTILGGMIGVGVLLWAAFMLLA